MVAYGGRRGVQVVTSLPPPDEGSNLHFSKLDEQLDLLTKVTSQAHSSGMTGALTEEREGVI